jgi:hypothetical protein
MQLIGMAGAAKPVGGQSSSSDHLIPQGGWVAHYNTTCGARNDTLIYWLLN